MIQETSIEALNSIKHELGSRQNQVLEFIKTNPSCSNMDISKNLGIPINAVTPRVKELREKGLVYEVGKKICRWTGRRVMVWNSYRHAIQAELFV